MLLAFEHDIKNETLTQRLLIGFPQLHFDSGVKFFLV